ncbi:Hypothetical protein, putative [Bodo saltans]|uniref:Uncharacterized protein n=1 Tax=Bodo saltans TaxID=75058 RepID=A0A0S4JNE2_BODSA|nr:Hypothetical protein, putative [Bodo saltans]|eukprot:CUG90792.1 Hypothetical protein, putative [Bodo saltans]
MRQEPAKQLYSLPGRNCECWPLPWLNAWPSACVAFGGDDCLLRHVSVPVKNMKHF